MARKRHSKGLFEVIGRGSVRSSKPLGVPGWFGQAKPYQPPPKPPPAPEELPQRVQLRVPAAAAAAPAAPAAPGVERVMSYSRGRLRISLNQVSTVVFFGVLLVLLILAFILGRQSGLAAASADPGEVRSGLDQGATTQPHVTPHPGPEPTSQGVRLSEMVPDDYSRPKGLQYLVIQDLVWTRQEAEDIKGFLYSHGINATIERMGRTRTYRIRDTKGFQSDRSEEAKEYKAQIERLGKEYRRRGRYDFVGAWFKPEL